jgi:hypothetical protein
MTVMGTLLFIVGGGKLGESTDSGTNWSIVPVDNLGSPVAVQCFATDGKNIFVGSPSGVLLSIDTGKNWRPVNDGLYYKNVAIMGVFDTLLFAGMSNVPIQTSSLYMRSIPEMVPPKNAVQPVPVTVRDTIAIYPNPATGLVTIFAGSTPIERVSVLNVLGVEVLTLDKPGGMSSNSEITLDLSKLPSGTYFLRIQTAAGSVLRKVVRE